MGIIFGEGHKENDIMQVIPCKGFGKLLNAKDCTKEKCKYHLERRQEDCKQGDKIVETIDRVLCGYPRWERVLTVCEGE